MNSKDPAGYYALLGISETASSAEIKTAFRQKAKELHPDRNSSPDAVHLFQQINNAYTVLINPETRARYDTVYAQITQSDLAYQKINLEPLEPITCSCCKKITAQPRYVIFYQVTSFILVTVRSPIQGIFCPKCAELKALQGTIVTWLMGWWGIPWGLAYSVITIFQNLLGGSKPNEVNVRLLTYQAYVFATQNKLEIARAVAADAQDLARTLKTKSEDEPKVLNLLEELSFALDTKVPIKRLKNTWVIPNRSFYIQGSILITFITLITVLFSYDFTKTKPIVSSTPTTNLVPQAEYVAPLESSQSPPTDPSENTPSVPDLPSPSPKPTYIRPTIADNGLPFPSISSYMDGYPLKMTDGYSNIIVDNSQNNSDVFAKLFTLDADPSGAVRAFFIRAGEQFKVENVRAGNYDIRYLDLNSGVIVRTDPFDLSEIETFEAIEFSEVTLTLYEVSGGNMQVHPISESEFNAIAPVPHGTN